MNGAYRGTGKGEVEGYVCTQGERRPGAARKQAPAHAGEAQEQSRVGMSRKHYCVTAKPRGGGRREILQELAFGTAQRTGWVVAGGR
jgi:hypothetical protein